ncbi:glycoside hydrolase family 15 protein [Nodosilinea sp. LEGE 07088]|uniref:glycoside hydrolase family 15 protein n=1 Tax=Nodosilinea sp. LEGE 07088 TaxID=2777968 RepID=UPI00187E0343|nr:glycoside hydrolase family 15 protein [Nodosilinea sp. LEGE 07088]MBE9137659.1 glycoside hydrolase family 15 protein [Nodosilinea sp. LEGE 07088]
MSSASLQERLDRYYHEIKTVILARQHPVSGLLPASTAVNVHGDYTDAWVRDNVYSILAVWGVALAYRHLDDDQGRTVELEQSVVKLMRGLLMAMTRQAEKVEQFKERQDPLQALHAKYDTGSGLPVVGDDEWGHLQIDATSVFLLMLAQMTASGLQIIFTQDEVNVVQNLVYYIGRAYRTPDYGIWERGNKINHGKPELNASSVGMAKAALEALRGFNLFGMRGGQASMIHVLTDEIARARITLESLLPRESGSKEVDAALLSIVGYPGFAIDDDQLARKTRQKIIDKLQGNYGCKRFLRDGHQTVIEDTTRLHYEPEELKQFEHIECEWPLFFTYLWLDSLFAGDKDQIRVYQERLAALTVDRDGLGLLPELYYVPEDGLEAERETPGSQSRLPNENLPLVWAQSLYLLGQLLQDGLLKPSDIDPLGRYRVLGDHRYPVVQVALLAEDKALQTELATYGLATQTLEEIDPVQVYPASELSSIYAEIGKNDKLGLSGRPVRRLRSLTTSRMFRIQGESVVFLPSFLDQQRFYLTLDYHFLVAQMRSELAYIYDHWREPGRPTVTLLLTHAMFQLGHKPIYESPLMALMKELMGDRCDHVPVKIGPLHQLMMTTSLERIDNVNAYQLGHASIGYSPLWTAYLGFEPGHDGPLSLLEEYDVEHETDLDRLLTQLGESNNVYEQIELLSTLKHLHGLNFNTGLGGSSRAVTVENLLNEVYAKASQLEQWGILRRAAGLLGKADITLSDAVTELLVRQKQISVGKAYSEASLITEPMSHSEIIETIRALCGDDVRDHVLNQEVLIDLSILIKAEPSLFDGLLTLRVGYLLLLITSELARERHIPQDEAYAQLVDLSPFELKTRLRQVLAGFDGLNQSIFRRESLHVKPHNPINWQVVPDAAALELEPTEPVQDWLRKRMIDGEIARIPPEFYTQVWEVLKHSKGIVIGNKFDRKNRIDSDRILSEMTPGEQNFERRITHLLNKIQAPEYRHVNLEALREMGEIFKVNPDLYFEDYLYLDVLIGHAVRLGWLDQQPDRISHYDADRAAAWHSFYQLPPTQCAIYIAMALQFLTVLGETEPEPEPEMVEEVV